MLLVDLSSSDVPSIAKIGGSTFHSKSPFIFKLLIAVEAITMNFPEIKEVQIKLLGFRKI